MTCDINCGAVLPFNKQIYFILLPEALRKSGLLIVKMLTALLTNLGSFLDSKITKNNKFAMYHNLMHDIQSHFFPFRSSKDKKAVKLIFLL
jgi:hypothetical protein